MENANLDSNHQISIFSSEIETPLGRMLIAAISEGICFLGFTDMSKLALELKAMTQSLNGKLVRQQHPHLLLLKQQLLEYFNGERKEFSVPYIVLGTDFQKKAWKIIQSVNYGTTISYKQQATLLENTKAIRAIAHANGKNKLPILIPCHRIIGHNGHLSGYSGGIWRKEKLLQLEGNCLF